MSDRSESPDPRGTFGRDAETEPDVKWTTGPLSRGLSALCERGDQKSSGAGPTKEILVRDLWFWIGAVPALALFIVVALALILGYVL